MNDGAKGKKGVYGKWRKKEKKEMRAADSDGLGARWRWDRGGRQGRYLR